MIDKRLRNEIAQCKLIISAVALLHFDSIITRFIKSSSECLGGSYKLLRGYLPSPPDRIHNCPFSKWRGVFIYFSIKVIVFYFLMKVDGQMSRVNRDKCPEHPWILFIIFSQ